MAVSSCDASFASSACVSAWGKASSRRSIAAGKVMAVDLAAWLKMFRDFLCRGCLSRALKSQTKPMTSATSAPANAEPTPMPAAVLLEYVQWQELVPDAELTVFVGVHVIDRVLVAFKLHKSGEGHVVFMKAVDRVPGNMEEGLLVHKAVSAAFDVPARACRGAFM